MRRLNTPKASAYLKEKGIHVTPGTLEVFRCQGRGPRYYKVGGRVYYDTPGLDEYAKGQVVETIDSMSAKRATVTH